METRFRFEEETDLALYAFPAWEVLCFTWQGNGLREHWKALGGDLCAGRMIARKDAPIWKRFTLKTGFVWRDICREDCIALGLIGEDTELRPMPEREREELTQIARNFSPEFLKALNADLDQAVEEGRAKLRQSHHPAAH